VSGHGGFYLEDRKDTEFAWLSECTGIPSDEIPRALIVYDVLFPTDGGSWVTSAGPSQCEITKMMPSPFLGIGAVHRRFRYQVEYYDALGYSDYTGRDLIRWNNKLVELLL